MYGIDPLLCMYVVFAVQALQIGRELRSMQWWKLQERRRRAKKPKAKANGTGANVQLQPSRRGRPATAKR